MGLGVVLRRNWLTVLLAVVLGATAGALLAQVQHKQYKSSASVQVTATGVQDSTSLANSRTSDTINLDTEAQLAKSTAVAQRVRSMNPARAALSTSDLTKHLSISVPPNTQVLVLTYTAGSPNAAAQFANDFARAYLDERRRTAQATLDAQLAKIRANLNALDSSLRDVTVQLATLPAKSEQRNYASARRALLISQITELNAQYDRLSPTVVTPGQQTTQATVPGSPASPSLMLYVAAGAACGLLLGLLLAWLQFAHASRMRRPEDVARRMHIPVAGSVASLREFSVEAAGSPRFADYQRIANRIRATLGDRGTVLVTGTSPTAPAGTVAANIASVLARLTGPVGMKLMTDADASSLTGLPENVRVVSRDDPTSPPHDIGSNTSQPGGYIVIAAPDPATSADVQTVASACDAVLVVVEAGTRVRDGRAAIDQLDAVGAPLLGAVVVLGRERVQPYGRDTHPGTASHVADRETTGVPMQDSGGVEIHSPNCAPGASTAHPVVGPGQSTSSGSDSALRARRRR
jgi:capsular polysaccharide biosynthesis protein